MLPFLVLRYSVEILTCVITLDRSYPAFNARHLHVLYEQFQENYKRYGLIKSDIIFLFGGGGGGGVEGVTHCILKAYIIYRWRPRLIGFRFYSNLCYNVGLF